MQDCTDPTALSSISKTALPCGERCCPHSCPECAENGRLWRGRAHGADQQRRDGDAGHPRDYSSWCSNDPHPKMRVAAKCLQWRSSWLPPRAKNIRVSDSVSAPDHRIGAGRCKCVRYCVSLGTCLWSCHRTRGLLCGHWCPKNA